MAPDSSHGTKHHLFLAGVPATGKTRLGAWLSDHGYIHIDAEVDGGIDFDRLGIHAEWNDVLATGRAGAFGTAVQALNQPVVINWGFPVEYLYVVSALRAAAFDAWWIGGDRRHARDAYVKRSLDGGGPHPSNFDPQMDAIERHWLLIESVFNHRIVTGLAPDGSHRHPSEIWAEIEATSCIYPARRS